MKKLLKILPLILLLIIFSCSDAGNDSSNVNTGNDPATEEEPDNTDNETPDDGSDDDGTNDESVDDTTNDGSDDEETTVETAATPVAIIGSQEISSSDTTVPVATSLILETETEDAAIYYELDGTEPTTDSTEYTSDGIELLSDSELRAIAVKDGMNDSDKLSLDINISDSLCYVLNDGEKEWVETSSEVSEEDYPNTMSGYQPLFPIAMSREAWIAQYEDTAIFGVPTFHILSVWGYNNEEWDNTIQIGLTKNSEYVSEYQYGNENDNIEIFSISVDGTSFTTGSESDLKNAVVTIEKIGTEGEEVLIKVSAENDGGDTVEIFVNTEMEKSTPFNLGTETEQYSIPIGQSVGMTGGGGTSYYVASGEQNKVYSLVLIPGLGEGGPSGLANTVSISSSGDPADTSVVPGTQGVINNLIPNSDGEVQFDVASTDGASYVMLFDWVEASYNDTAQFEDEYGSDGINSLSPGSGGTIGTDGEYNTRDIQGMLTAAGLDSLTDLITSADEFRYGYHDTATEWIIITHYSDDSYRVFNITEDQYNSMDSEDP